jgi:hypothetical protein
VETNAAAWIILDDPGLYPFAPGVAGQAKGQFL